MIITNLFYPFQVSTLIRELNGCAEGGPHRGYIRGGPRGGRLPNNRQTRSAPLRFDGEFDFESANAQFDKDQIEKELKEKLIISELNRHCMVNCI